MMSANLRAFLYLIRWCEGTSDENGYRALYGHRKDAPKLFDSFADHPRQSFDTQWGKTSAAGAYQFLSGTWDDAKNALDLPDFSPESQDRAAIWLIQRRGALHAVEEGNLDQALHLCNKEWASLPGSPYGQPTRSLDACKTIFERAGGTLMQVSGTAPRPVVEPPAPSFPSTESEPNIMPLPVAAIAALGVELLKLLPFAKKPENKEAVEKIGPQLVDIAKQVAGPGAVNEQAAVETVQKNPQAQQAFVAAAAAKWSDLAPILEFEAAQRKEARSFTEHMTSGNDWRSIGWGILIGILSLTIVVGGGLLFWNMMDSPQLDPGQKGLILGALIASFTTVVGFFFGSSASGRQAGQTVSDIAKSR